MNKLPPEKIDGKMYQPVEDNGASYTCDDCAVYHDRPMLWGRCEAKCTKDKRNDKLDIHYTNIGGE